MLGNRASLGEKSAKLSPRIRFAPVCGSWEFPRDHGGRQWPGMRPLAIRQRGKAHGRRGGKAVGAGRHCRNQVAQSSARFAS